jgi:hypothetical protein
MNCFADNADYANLQIGVIVQNTGVVGLRGRRNPCFMGTTIMAGGDKHFLRILPGHDCCSRLF